MEFPIGQKVEVMSGPAAGLHGVIAASDERDWCKVLFPDSELELWIPSRHCAPVEDAAYDARRAEFVDEATEVVCNALQKGIHPIHIRADVEAMLSIQLDIPGQ